MENKKFELKQHVWCNNKNHKSEVGVIAEFEEDLLDDEYSYMVMLHDEKGKMYFEEFVESELELVDFK
jgi:hypothetical protein